MWRDHICNCTRSKNSNDCFLVCLKIASICSLKFIRISQTATSTTTQIKRPSSTCSPRRNYVNRPHGANKKQSQLGQWLNNILETNILVHSMSFCVGQPRMSHQIPFLPTVDMMMTRNSCPWNSSTEPTLMSDRPTLPSRSRIFSHWREIKKQGHYWVAKCKAT